MCPGLKGEACTMLRVDNANKLVAYRRWKSGTTNQDVVVVANFAGVARTNYSLSFPQTGNWYARFNSDSTRYGTDYGDIGSSLVTAQGANPTGAITIGPYSALVLSQVPFPPQLTVSQTGSVITVSWPAAFSGWVLDATPSPAPNQPSWVQVPTAQYLTNSTSIFINATASASNSFYRLRLP